MSVSVPLLSPRSTHTGRVPIIIMSEVIFQVQEEILIWSSVPSRGAMQQHSLSWGHGAPWPDLTQKKCFFVLECDWFKNGLVTALVAGTVAATTAVTRPHLNKWGHPPGPGQDLTGPGLDLTWTRTVDSQDQVQVRSSHCCSWYTDAADSQLDSGFPEYSHVPGYVKPHHGTWLHSGPLCCVQCLLGCWGEERNTLEGVAWWAPDRCHNVPRVHSPMEERWAEV